MFAESDDDDRRRDKFPRERERENRRDDDRYNGAVKRSGGRRDDYANGSKRNRLDDDARDDGVMLSFKRFLLTQDDDITDEAAVTKYNEYKLEFKKTQLSKFFLAHKDEEWFRQKYHPEEVSKLNAIQLTNVKKRLEIFLRLQSEGVLSSVTLDIENAKEIIRILDSVVVLLEGGSDEDLEALKNEEIEDESITDLEKQKGENNNENKPKEEKTVNEDDKKKQILHKTSSIFLRNIPPTATTDEIEAVCKRSAGFLRIAMADAQPDRKWARRAWATFKRNVSIKDVCWNVNSVRVRECDLNAIINRDITRRLRTTNGVVAHKQVAQNDLRLATKLVAILDKRVGLFGDDEIPLEEREKDITLGVDIVSQSQNPLVKQAKNVLMDIDADELSPEEEMLLKRNAGSTSEEKSVFNRDTNILKTIDELVFYLRIVHSVDFYGHLDYPNEDSMPSRCGIFHVRGPAPDGAQFGTNDDGNVLLSNKYLADFTAGFNSRLEESLLHNSYVTEEEKVKLGKQDKEKEVEAFIEKNTVELAKDKWLCPLSGKKFKGPEFIKKHLMTKHEHKLEEVRQDVDFFNNYLSDAKRPVEPEVKQSAPPPREEDRRDDRYRSSDRSRPPPARSSYGGGGGNYSNPPRDYGRSSSGGRYFDDRRDSRPQISYKDLDQPEEIA